MAASGEIDLFHHVLDSNKLEFFPELMKPNGYILLPKIPYPWGGGFQITKFMVLELLAALLIIAIYVPLARRVARGDVPRGAWWNIFEALLTFIRDSVARPSLRAGEHLAEGGDAHGDHPAGHTAREHGHAAVGHGHGHHHGHDHGHHVDPDAEVDKYVPYLWTVFLFILFCNLLGMFPFMGSPTSSLVVTGVLATFSFILFHGAASVKMGFAGYMQSLWPKIDMPVALGIFVKPMIFAIELFGTVSKSCVLAVRLFANLFAGHLVLSVILTFIVMANTTALGVIGWGGITVASVLGVVALSLLELFVAFLQAFIFTFLTALFLGMAINPAH